MMDEVEDAWKFSVVDYVVFMGVLAISFGIGVFSSFRGNKSPEDFLMGSRSMSRVPVSMSLLCSFVSAVHIIGLTSEVYSFGTQLFTEVVGFVVGIGFSMVVTIPVLYPLKLTSVHEYMEMRYDSKNIQLVMMILVYFNSLIYMGICLYATCISMATIAPLSYTTFLLVTGFICTLYSSVGGIRAVVWTDVFQLVVMTSGLMVVIGVGLYQIGGFGPLFQISNEGNRVQIFNMNPSIYERHTLLNTVTFGAFANAALFGISQINTQRICAVPSLTDARIVLCYNMVGNVIIKSLLFLGGLVVYATYAGCDPFLNGQIEKRDGILSFFVVDQLGHLYGLPGIFLATLLASTLSTFSSIVNAQVAILWKDLFARFAVCRETSDSTATLINKILTLVTGAAFIGMAFLTAQAVSIIQMALAVFGIIFGSIFGVFLLGMCFPTSNIKGAWSGLITSIVFLVWVYSGSLAYGTRPTPLPFAVELCKNESIGNSSIYSLLSKGSNEEVNLFVSLDSDDVQDHGSHAGDVSQPSRFGLLYLYDMSYTLYSILGPLLCILVGVIVSYITGPTKVEDLRPELITPIVRKLYKMEMKSPKSAVEPLKNNLYN